MIDTVPNISIARELCNDPSAALRHEWLVTNGIGGFAMGTIAGGLTRRYHGLLIAALNPPLGRTLMATKLDETLTVAGEEFRLSTNVWKDGVEKPAGCRWIERFDLLAGGIPKWEYACGAARLTKCIWMEHGHNTTYLRYELSPASTLSTLHCRLLVNYRDYHALTPNERREFQIEQLTMTGTVTGLRVVAGEGATPLVVLCAAARDAANCVGWMPQHDWYRDFDLPFETSVGYEHREDHLCAGTCSVNLRPGGAVTFVFSAEASPDVDDAAALARCADRAAGTLTTWMKRPPTPHIQLPAALPHLVIAADQFIVRRSMPDAPDGHTIIAGYPWFTDWGRDTMISLPGLTLSTGRFDVARQILLTWARVVDRGMIPNRFPDASDKPEYNTADATLWYLWAIGQYYAATGDRKTLAELFPVMAEIVACHERGTRYNIGMDDDGLIYAGQAGVNLTWMDAKVGDWVVTPRIGKPIELSALWHDGLRSLAHLATELGRTADEYAALAERTRTSFARFWNSERGCCFDVIDGPAGAGGRGGTEAPRGDDARIQANQIFAVSLDHSPLPPAQQRAVVDTVERELLTPFGLRTLARGEPGYHGRYEGRLRERDEAYHQGTAWGWLLGPFVIAHHRVYRDSVASRRFLSPMLEQLQTHCIGTLAEIYDGDAPHTPRGCAAQAWSVAETLRAWRVTQGR